jgi:hypothetical protein
MQGRQVGKAYFLTQQFRMIKEDLQAIPFAAHSSTSIRIRAAIASSRARAASDPYI